MTNDIASELEKLHDLQGADFVKQLKLIAARREFYPLEDEPNILIVGGKKNADFLNLVNAARKAVSHGNRVFILPNPKDNRTADLIFEQRGIYKMYDLKTIFGRASALNRLKESIGQTNHVLLNMISSYNGGRLAAEIRTYFKLNPHAVEVLIYKGGRQISIKRSFAEQPSFIIMFRKCYK